MKTNPTNLQVTIVICSMMFIDYVVVANMFKGQRGKNGLAVHQNAPEEGVSVGHPLGLLSWLGRGIHGLRGRIIQCDACRCEGMRCVTEWYGVQLCCDRNIGPCPWECIWGMGGCSMSCDGLIWSSTTHLHHGLRVTVERCDEEADDQRVPDVVKVGPVGGPRPVLHQSRGRIGKVPDTGGDAAHGGVVAPEAQEAAAVVTPSVCPGLDSCTKQG